MLEIRDNKIYSDGQEEIDPTRIGLLFQEFAQRAQEDSEYTYEGFVLI